MAAGRVVRHGKLLFSKEPAAVDGTIPAEKGPRIVGKCCPGSLDRMLRRGEGYEDEASIRVKHATHLPECGTHLWGRQHVEEIAGEDGVEGVLRVRKGCGISLAEAVASVRHRRELPAGTVEHCGGAVYAFGPAGRVGVDELFEGQAGAGANIQNDISVFHVEPGLAQRPRSAGEEGDNGIVKRRKSGVSDS